MGIINKYKIVFLLLLIVRKVQGQAKFKEKPESSAVTKGKTAMFSCQADRPNQPILWSYSNDSNDFNEINIALNDDVYSQDQSISVVYDNDTSLSNLTISDVTINHTLIYRCQLLSSSQNAFAQLVVLESDPECLINATLPQVVENDLVAISCKLTYFSTSPLDAAMTWSFSNGTDILPLVSKEHNTLATAYVHTITRDLEGQTFKVTTNFLSSDKTKIKPPEYSYTFISEPIHVLYPVAELTFYNERDVYDILENVTCHADGQPPPTYTWTSDDGIALPGAVLTMTPDLVGQNNWTCTATNVIDGVVFRVSDTVSFIVTTEQETPTMTSESTAITEITKATEITTVTEIYTNNEDKTTMDDNYDYANITTTPESSNTTTSDSNRNHHMSPHIVLTLLSTYSLARLMLCE